LFYPALKASLFYDLSLRKMNPLPLPNTPKQNFKAIYVMSTPEERVEIINRIKNGSINTNVQTGIKAKWWSNKHHPEEDIPKNIYLIGGGVTLMELHGRYNVKYARTPLDWHAFSGYTRELIMQGIMREVKP